MSDHPLETIQSALSESQRFATANEAHFDQRARPSDDSHHENHELARRTLAAMNKAWPELFDEDYTEAMDYACGTGASPQLGCFGASEGLSPHLLPGMVSQQLCQHVKSVVGVDISQVSVDRYNARASEQGLSPSEMRAVRAELKGELADERSHATNLRKVLGANEEKSRRRVAELEKSSEAQSQVTAVQTQTTNVHGDAIQTVTSELIAHPA